MVAEWSPVKRRLQHLDGSRPGFRYRQVVDRGHACQTAIRLRRGCSQPQLGKGGSQRLPSRGCADVLPAGQGLVEVPTPQDRVRAPGRVDLAERPVRADGAGDDRGPAARGTGRAPEAPRPHEDQHRVRVTGAGTPRFPPQLRATQRVRARRSRLSPVLPQLPGPTGLRRPIRQVREVRLAQRVSPPGPLRQGQDRVGIDPGVLGLRYVPQLGLAVIADRWVKSLPLHASAVPLEPPTAGLPTDIGGRRGPWGETE